MFKNQDADLTDSSLERLHEIAAHSPLQKAVKNITIFATIYNLSQRGQEEDREVRITDAQFPVFQHV